ncbi:unnamed protein product [Rhizopus stolonifer]
MTVLHVPTTHVTLVHGQRTASRKKAKISTSAPRTILHRPISQGKLEKDAIQSSSVPRDSSGPSVSALQSKFPTIPNTAETSSTTIHVEQQQSEASNYYPDSIQPLIPETEATLPLTELSDHDGARDAEKVNPPEITTEHQPMDSTAQNDNQPQTSTNSELKDEVMMDSETNQPSGSEPANQSTGIQPVQQQRQTGITSVHKAGGPIRSSSKANKGQHPKRSLNCRSLSTPNNPYTRQHFTRFIRSTQIDILTFQETHASSLEIQRTLDMLLQTKSSCWSSHCGIVSLNKSINIQPICSSIDHRFILTSVDHINHAFDPFYILTLYAPASSPERRRFYSSLAEFTPITSLLQSPSHRIVVIGDFNHTYDSFIGAPQSWRDLVDTTLQNCFSDYSGLSQTPTFRRGNSSSTIDYVFASSTLYSFLQECSVDFVNSEWTDHALLSVSFKFSSSR